MDKYTKTVLKVIAVCFVVQINSKIIDHVFKENRCILILVNKIDTQTSLSKSDITEHIYYLTPQIKGIPICFVSAKKSIGFETFYKSLLYQLKSWKNRIPTNNLNTWLSTAINKTPHPMYNACARGAERTSRRRHQHL